MAQDADDDDEIPEATPEEQAFLMSELAVRASEYGARIRKLEAALQPFATFGADNVDADGWNGKEQRASIQTWFGPSEFRAARDALGTLPGAE